MHLCEQIERYHQLAYAEDAYGQRRFREVCAWFASPDRHDPRAFLSICIELGFDPARIRDTLGRRYVAALSEEP